MFATRPFLTALLISAALLGCGGGGGGLPDAMTIMATWETSSIAPDRCVSPDEQVFDFSDLTSDTPRLGTRPCEGVIEGDGEWEWDCLPIEPVEAARASAHFSVEMGLTGGTVRIDPFLPEATEPRCSATFRITSIVER